MGLRQLFAAGLIRLEWRETSESGPPFRRHPGRPKACPGSIGLTASTVTAVRSMDPRTALRASGVTGVRTSPATPHLRRTAVRARENAKADSLIRPSAFAMHQNQGRLFDRMVMSRHRVESELRHRRIPHPLEHPLCARHFVFDAGELLAEPLRTKPTCGACGAERNQLRQHTKTPLSPRTTGRTLQAKSPPDRSCLDG